MDTWQVIDDERLALANDPALLGHSRWDIQSACSDWKIRHVVGHLIAGAEVKVGPFLGAALRSHTISASLRLGVRVS